MTIKVTDDASAWFKRELDLPATGAGIRFYGKVYGKTNVHDGFSVGMSRDDQVGQPYEQTQKDGVTYFVAPGDDWFFQNLDLTVDYDAHRDEPVYRFKEVPAHD